MDNGFRPDDDDVLISEHPDVWTDGSLVLRRSPVSRHRVLGSTPTFPDIVGFSEVGSSP